MAHSVRCLTPTPSSGGTSAACSQGQYYLVPLFWFLPTTTFAVVFAFVNSLNPLIMLREKEPPVGLPQFWNSVSEFCTGLKIRLSSRCCQDDAFIDCPKAPCASSSIVVTTTTTPRVVDPDDFEIISVRHSWAKRRRSIKLFDTEKQKVRRFLQLISRGTSSKPFELL